MAEAITSFLKEHRLRAGMAKEELRSGLSVPPRIFTLLRETGVASGGLVDKGASVASADWRRELTPAQRAKAARPVSPRHPQ